VFRHAADDVALGDYPDDSTLLVDDGRSPDPIFGEQLDGCCDGLLRHEGDDTIAFVPQDIRNLCFHVSTSRLANLLYQVPGHGLISIELDIQYGENNAIDFVRELPILRRKRSDEKYLRADAMVRSERCETANAESRSSSVRSTVLAK
jgi:hypothetical protein